METILAAITVLKEFFRFSAQIAENKGQKIKLTEDEIRQRSRNRTERLQDRGYLKKWMGIVTFYQENLKAKERLHAKNQLRQLVKSDADILSIEMWYGDQGGRTGNWLVITYSRDGNEGVPYKREYYIQAKGLIV